MVTKPDCSQVCVSGEKVPGLSAIRIHSLTLKMLSSLSVYSCDISIVFLSDRAMRKLNRESLGHDYVTDVVTFDLGSKKVRSEKREVESEKQRKSSFHLEGEIYVCPSEARRNAKEFGESVPREVLRYIAHGLLHLVGNDDATPAQRAKMRVKESDLLEQLVGFKVKRLKGQKVNRSK